MIKCQSLVSQSSNEYFKKVLAKNEEIKIYQRKIFSHMFYGKVLWSFRTPFWAAFLLVNCCTAGLTRRNAESTESEDDDINEMVRCAHNKSVKTQIVRSRRAGPDEWILLYMYILRSPHRNVCRGVQTQLEYCRKGCLLQSAARPYRSMRASYERSAQKLEKIREIRRPG